MSKNPLAKKSIWNDDSRLRVIRFENALEAVVKRHKPIDWAQAAANKLAIVSNPMWTAFELLHSIEASCAYARGYLNDPVTEYRLRQAVNAFRMNEEPYEEHVLMEDDDVHMFMQLLFRRQIEVQEHSIETRHMLGRFHLMFGKPDLANKSLAILDAIYGLTLDAWATYCIGAYGQAVKGPCSRFRLASYDGAGGGLFSEQSLTSFKSLSCRTPEDVRDQYKGERDGLQKPYMHICLRSGFLSKPVIDFGEGRFLAPQPHLLVKHLFTGLETAVRDIDESTWSDDCGVCLEAYVLSLLERTYDSRLITRPDRDGEVAERRCDFLINLDECHLLIECKATRFRQRLLVRENLRRDSSSCRLRDAFEQIVATAHAIPANHRAKPVIGLIIVLDEIVAVNTEWYWMNVIQPSDSNDPSILECRPQILPIVAFETLISLLRHGSLSVLGLVRDQIGGQQNLMRADWSKAIMDLCRQRGVNPTPDEIKVAFEEFTRRIAAQIPA